jgi:hypothetical protein
VDDEASPLTPSSLQVRFISKAAVSVQSWLTSSSSSIKDKVLAAAQAIDGATISSFARPAPNVDEVEASVRERTEQYALNRGEPVDWVLQVGPLGLRCFVIGMMLDGSGPDTVRRR